jgi:hypothetical protein
MNVKGRRKNILGRARAGVIADEIGIPATTPLSSLAPLATSRPADDPSSVVVGGVSPSPFPFDDGAAFAAASELDSLGRVRAA